MKKTIYTAALLLLLPAAGAAQTADILGITTDGSGAQLKARLHLDGKTLQGATAYSYNMTDGYTVRSRDFSLVSDGSNTYLSADVVYYPDADGYAYRLELTFTDGTTYRSEVVNLDLSRRFYWLSDYDWTDSKTGWEGHKPVNDGEVDPSLKMSLDGTVYYKGVSNHGDGFLEYDFTELQAPEFSSFYTKYGVQDDRPDGDIYFSFSTDGHTRLERQLMYSKTNPERKDNPCVREIEFPMEGVNVLRIDENLKDNNYGAHAHLAMARLYLPSREVSKKEQQVEFSTPGGTLDGELTLEATSSSRGKVFYSIVGGRECATLDGDVLRPVWGSKGRVTVEATQYGDDTYYPATSYIYFDVDFRPRMEMLGLYRPSVRQADGTAYAYLLVDTKGKPLDMLTATVFDNVKTLKEVSETSLLEQLGAATGASVVEIPIKDYSGQVVRVSYSYDGDDAVTLLPYWHEEGSYDYISDLPSSAWTAQNGYGSFPGANHTFDKMNGDVLEIGTGSISHGTYARGFGFHAPGAITVLPASLSPYCRVAADIGPQKNPNHNYSGQKLSFQLSSGNVILADTVDIIKPGFVSWDYPINNQAALKMAGNPGSDGNGNDYVCLGAARLYYASGAKTPQSLVWDTGRRLTGNSDITVRLDAESESGFPVIYHIVKGSEYARLEDRCLVIGNPTVGGAEIVVDAVQPGNDVWAVAPVATCVFTITRGLEVQKNEYVELGASDVYDELIVHADHSGAGQVNVKSGLLDVKRLTVKFEFELDEWTHIAFPADLDLERISNLRELGYGYNAFGAPGYYLMEPDIEDFLPASGETRWVTPERPLVKGGRGYLMKVGGNKGDGPVEVTFTIDNTSADLSEVRRGVGLSLDFSGMQRGTHTVTVASANPAVQSNNLTVEVTYNPSDLSSVPVDHARALENMRYVFVSGHRALRLTLPDPSPAKVVFFDRKGERIVKAVRYVAPNVIDLSDLKPGRYNMMVSYGPATRNFEIEL